MALKKKKSKFTQVSASANKKKVTATGNTNGNGFPVVAIGGSAGSFKSLEKFFSNMPKSGIAFVVVLHLDPNHKAKISELIQNYTSMPVKEAEDGKLIKPDHVYVIPPNRDLGLHNGRLLLLSPDKPRGYRMPIDFFFQSLAEDQWNRAVGIILSGMGSDGETGIRVIKEKLGMVMVEDPETAEYNSMPRAAISTNLVDYVLSPEDMPINLVRYLKHPAVNDAAHELAGSEARNSNAFQKILMTLRSQTGNDFSQYKKNTITRRIDRRVAFHQLADYSEYVNYLRENPAESTVLFNELLIGVTKFFRDPLAFDSLKKHFGNLLKNKKEKESVRVWIAGCSTGEEAYSIAMILVEVLESQKNKKMPRVQIFATDLDAEALDKARAGNYLGNIVGEVSKQRIERFFTKTTDGYQVKKELRELIVFAHHNLIKDAPFTKVDVLSCRNLLIYLTNDLQKKIIPLFYYSINPKGLLMLGPAETLGGYSDMFRPVDAKWKISEKKEGAAQPLMFDFPINVIKNQPILKGELTTGSLKKSPLQEYYYKILLENYTPSSLLVDARGDILFINGKMNLYLELTSGEAQMNIHRMAREELKYALSNAMHQSRTTKGVVMIDNINLPDGKETHVVSLKVVYFEDSNLQGLQLVLFYDVGPVSKKKKLRSGHSQEVQEMEKQLYYTKQQLNNTIEQMETSLEELKSTNEELQSTNEELQSTNEESLTTKEELQSLNEELMTVNLQYQSKAEELTLLNNDMKNLLDSTEIGTIFLNTDLTILRFTPQIKSIFNVISSDIGRSITHLVSNLESINLEKDIREVIEKLTRKEMDVKTKNGEWFNLRIIPYRTLNNFINGAVLTFKPITSLKEFQHKLKLFQQSMLAIIETYNDPVLLLDDELNIMMSNKLFLKFFHIKEQQIIGKHLKKLLHEEWKIKKLDALLKNGGTRTSINFQFKIPGKGLTKMVVTGTPLFHDDKNAFVMLLLFNKAGK